MAATFIATKISGIFCNGAFGKLVYDYNYLS